METNGHPVSAASGEPEVQRYSPSLTMPPYVDVAELSMEADASGDYVRYADYLALAQQRDATERLCEQHEGKIHELRDLLTDCAQQRDAAVRVLVEFVDAEAAFGEETSKNNPYIVTDTWQQSARRLDAARKALKDYRAAVAPTPPQDAATTRGEGC